MKQDPQDRLAQVTALLERAGNDSGDAVPAARDEAIARIAGALKQRRRQRNVRFVAIVAAAAAVVVLGIGAAAMRGTHAPREARAAASSEQARVSMSANGLTTVRDGHEAAPKSGERLGDGTELRTSSGSEAQLDFDRGSRLALGAESRVRLVEQTRHKRFALESGSVRAKVAKLEADERFVVTTGDSEIEVRGTEFEVRIAEPDPSCGGGTATRVDVREGVVVVRHDGHEERVAAGESWPRCAKSEPTAAVSATPRSPHPRATPPPSPSAVTAVSPGSPAALPTPSSRLAEQNDLFQEAMRKKRNGDAKGALEALDRLHASYGDGPLAENAEVERFRILAGVDRARAAAAAREYLRNRPHGFARAEAESLSGTP